MSAPGGAAPASTRSSSGKRRLDFDSRQSEESEGPAKKEKWDESFLRLVPAVQVPVALQSLRVQVHAVPEPIQDQVMADQEPFSLPPIPEHDEPVVPAVQQPALAFNSAMAIEVWDWSSATGFQGRLYGPG